jgi:hypothetical protein
VEGFRVVTAMGEKGVGSIVGAQGDYFIAKRSFGRGRCRLPKRKVEAPKVQRNGQLGPATDGHYSR